VRAREKPGNRALRRALARHEPTLARSLSELEFDFVVFCERYQIPIPVINPWVHGIKVDACWPAYRLVVEVDGGQNHTTVGQLRLDRSKELTLRSHGIGAALFLGPDPRGAAHRQARPPRPTRRPGYEPGALTPGPES
jgi:very-short-patch-repair endonuclease